MTAKVFAPRPDHVFVGNHCYNIEWLTKGEWEARRLDPEADASTYATQQYMAVLIHEDVQESHYQELVLHELTHAVWDATMLTHVDLKEIDDPEEFIASAQSPGLLFVFKQNPDLVKWLMSDGTARR